MKPFLTILAIIALSLPAVRPAAADEPMSGPMDKQDKMITNDDLQKLEPDQDRTTINQMPAGSAEGTSPGGVSSDRDTLKKDDGQEKAPETGTPEAPERSEPAPERPSSDTSTMPGY